MLTCVLARAYFRARLGADGAARRGRHAAGAPGMCRRRRRRRAGTAAVLLARRDKVWRQEGATLRAVPGAVRSAGDTRQRRPQSHQRLLARTSWKAIMKNKKTRL